MGHMHSREGFTDVVPRASYKKPASTTTSTSKSSTILSSTSLAPAISSQVTLSEPITTSNSPPIRRIEPPPHAISLDSAIITTRGGSNDPEFPIKLDDGIAEVDRFVIPESVRKSRDLEEFVGVCSEILPGCLYVSSFQVAQDHRLLQKIGITHVINCCKEHTCEPDAVNSVNDPSPIHYELEFLRLAIRDDVHEDLTPFLYQVVDYIEQCRAVSKGKVLIHCHQGISRSCAFAIAYIMSHCKLSVHDAVAFVKSKRSISSPNAAFLCQLIEWERELAIITGRNSCGGGYGLYRLAPHAPYDSEYFVLKRCYIPNRGDQPREPVAIVSEADRMKWFWSKGIFVYVNPDDSQEIVIWKGAAVEIPDAIEKARLEIDRMARVLLLAPPAHLAHFDPPTANQGGFHNVKIIREQAPILLDAANDHFAYAVELSWWEASRNRAVDQIDCLSEPNREEQPRCSAGLPVVKPQLYLLEEMTDHDGGVWEHLTEYDSQDLTADNAFVLFIPDSLVQNYLWIGTTCTIVPDKLQELAQMHIQSLLEANHSLTQASIAIERQDEESDEFWEYFEMGY